MAFLCELVGKPVVDIDGERLGTLSDIIATARPNITHPQLTAILVKEKDKTVLISMGDVVALIPTAITLSKKLSQIENIQPGENDLYLARDVLDRQIIDTNGARVVRVNDLELTRVKNDFFISNVDIGGAALLRRLGLSGLARKMPVMKGNTPGFISWDDVELLAGDGPIRLKVPGEKISELHPADLAEILTDLNRAEGSKLLETLDVELVADTLEEVEPEFQVSLVQGMDNDKVADVLEEMAPDEAADLLAELPEDRSKELLNLMEDEEAEDVRRLLSYPEESAGGIMNTEFVTVHSELTAAEAIEFIRQTANEAETIYYIYVVDELDCLIGVFSLRELVLARPNTPVSEIMEDRVVSVNVLDTQEHCAQMISKYNLLAIPVIGELRRLEGIVTADDALDKIIPTAWKKRLPRMYH